MADEHTHEQFRWRDGDGLRWTEQLILSGPREGECDYAVTDTDGHWGVGPSVKVAYDRLGAALLAEVNATQPPAVLCTNCGERKAYLFPVVREHEWAPSGFLCMPCYRSRPSGVRRAARMFRTNGLEPRYVAPIFCDVCEDPILSDRLLCRLPWGSTASVCSPCWWNRPAHSQLTIEDGEPRCYIELGHCLGGTAGPHGHSHIVASDHGQHVMRYDSFGTLIRDERPLQLRCTWYIGSCQGIDIVGQHRHIVAGSSGSYAVIFDDDGNITFDGRPWQMRG